MEQQEQQGTPQLITVCLKDDQKLFLPKQFIMLSEVVTSQLEDTESKEVDFSEITIDDFQQFIPILAKYAEVAKAQDDQKAKKIVRLKQRLALMNTNMAIHLANYISLPELLDYAVDAWIKKNIPADFARTLQKNPQQFQSINDQLVIPGIEKKLQEATFIPDIEEKILRIISFFYLWRNLDGHTDWVQCLQKLSKNRLASGSDKTIKIWRSCMDNSLKDLLFSYYQIKNT